MKMRHVLLFLTGWGLMIGLLALGGCASVDLGRAARRLQAAQVALDVLVEDRGSKWADKQSQALGACELLAEAAGDACLADPEPRDCATEALEVFDGCADKTLAALRKASDAFERLVQAQRALIGLTEALETLDEVVR
jgi:hypothetical protein